MSRIYYYLITWLLILSLVACAQPVAGDVVQSEKPRDTNPPVNSGDISELVSGNADFAFNLYKFVASNDENLFYSPYSISVALAMVYAGSRGDTEQQMSKALRFHLPQERLHPAFNATDIKLEKRGQTSKGKDDKGFRLNIVNAIWGQKNYSFLPAFLDILAENYGAGLHILDFIKSPENSRLTINKWISDQTENRIKDLIPQGLIDQLTRLVLTNAIYFNAAWEYPFNASATKDEIFQLLNGKQVSVPMMRNTKSFKYMAGTGFQAVELPYDGREMSMVIVLPDSGQFGSFEKSLDAGAMQDIISKLQARQVDLTMPKFEYESSFSPKQALIQMGMTDAFSETADFSGIAGNKELFITDIIHKAFVSVDEEGTEAAAATAVIVGVTSIPAMPISMKIDRPFIFLIRDIETGAILFIGRVMNPADS